MPVRTVAGFLLLGLLTAGPAAPAADAEDRAGEIRALLDDARDAGARERVSLLEAALERLDRLADPPGDLERATVEAALRRARTAPVIAIDCARAADHACLLERAGALIDEHRLDELRPELGRELARHNLAGAHAVAQELDRSGDRLGGSAVIAASAAELVTRGRDGDAGRLIRERVETLGASDDPERVHRLLSFAANLLGDGLREPATPVFDAADRAAREAIEAVPPSAAAEAVLVMYRAQALAGLGRSDQAVELTLGLHDGPLVQGRLGLAAVLAKRGAAEALERLAVPFDDDWRINSALVEAYARSGRYKSAVELAQSAERAPNRWLRLRLAAEAMAARGDVEPAAQILGALERAAGPAQLLGLAALWREVGRPADAERLREAFVAALVDAAGERLEQPVAAADEAAAVAGWTLGLARTLAPG